MPLLNGATCSWKIKIILNTFVLIREGITIEKKDVNTDNKWLYLQVDTFKSYNVIIINLKVLLIFSLHFLKVNIYETKIVIFGMEYDFDI